VFDVLISHLKTALILQPGFATLNLIVFQNDAEISWNFSSFFL